MATKLPRARTPDSRPSGSLVEDLERTLESYKKLPARLQDKLHGREIAEMLQRLKARQ